MLLSPQPSDKSSGPPPALLSSPLIPERLGRYRVHERLAVGGMAEIFLGESIGAGGFRKLVVLKRILPQLARDQRYIRMFLDEGRLAARMSHPGIPLVFDAGVEDGDHFLAMEYVHGQNLHQVLRRMSERGLALDLRAAANLVAQVSAALNYAHGLRDEGGRPLGLVHRDVSPSNIIISYDGNAKLIDFGIAKSLTQSVRTQHGALKGKYSYMAPEQVRGEPLDGRADVFALGSVLYQLVTGRRPFPGQQFTALSSIEAGCYQPPRAFAQTFRRTWKR